MSIRAIVQLQPSLAPIEVTVVREHSKGYDVILKSGMKMSITQTQLVRIIQAPRRVKTQVAYDRKHLPQTLYPVLDVHGKTVSEAQIEIHTFLEHHAGVQRVEIIFGKGTGALKKGLTPFVKRHRQVGSVYVDHLRAAFEITLKK